MKALHILILTLLMLHLKVNAQQHVVLRGSTIKASQGEQLYPISKDLHVAKLSGVDRLTIALPIAGHLTELELRRKALYSDEASIVTSSGEVYPLIDSRAFVGRVKGAERSTVSMVITGGSLQAIIAADGQTYELTTERSHYRLYEPSLPNDHVQECFEKGKSRPTQLAPPGYKMTSGDCIEIYTEVDFQSFLDNGSSVAVVNTWINEIMVPVVGFYDKISIPMTISEIFVWTTPDPYTGGDPLAVINQFINQRQNNYNGRVAQLLTTRNIGGGIAEGIGGLCGSYPQTPSPYLVAGNLDLTILPAPSYTAAVQLVAHELGHVIGARHTHACVWNGNSTQIDDCGNEHALSIGGFPEGSACFDPLSPIAPPNGGGTLMSRCELTAATVDLSLGFDSQVGAALNAAYNAATCQTGVVCPTFVPGNDLCAGAIAVAVKNSCVADEYDNFSATSSGAQPGYSCGSVGSVIDVWFTVQVPASGSLTIETTQIAGGLTDMVVEAYTGSCASLSSIGCDDNSGAGSHSQLLLSGRTPDETIWIRVVDSGSNEQGSFGLCVYDPSLPCHPSYDGLLALYNATGGSSWLNRSGWQDGAAGTDCDVCNWYGIVCDIQDRVVQLRLEDNNLTGSLPVSFGGVGFLQWLDLGDNNITGPLPAWLSDQDSIIVLDVADNGMNGVLDLLPDLQNLSVAYLNDNGFTGSLPANLTSGTIPTVLDFSNNTLSGCIPISYTALCGGSVDLSSNFSLSNTDFSTFCSDGFGGDFDGDGFCSGNQFNNDCLDDDPASYPGAPELCDGYDNDCNGTADDGISSTVTWQGSVGAWAVASNWSTGIVPSACTDVIVPSGAVSVNSLTEGFARSVTINGGVLTIDGTLEVRGSPANGTTVASAGELVVNGPLRIFDSSSRGLEVAGSLIQTDSIIVSGSSVGMEMIVAPSASVSQTGGQTILRP